MDYFRKVFKVMVEERGGYERELDGKRDLLDALLKMRQDAKKDNQGNFKTILTLHKLRLFNLRFNRIENKTCNSYTSVK